MWARLGPHLSRLGERVADNCAVEFVKRGLVDAPADAAGDTFPQRGDGGLRQTFAVGKPELRLHAFERQEVGERQSFAAGLRCVGTA